MNSYLLINIKKKLKKSLVNISNLNKEKNQILIKKIDQKDKNFNSQRYIFFASKRVLYNFLLFFSKNFIHQGNKRENYIIFLRFFEYFNSFIFQDKLFFYKKYFIKKRDPLYLNNFFFKNKQIFHDRGFERLKKKRIDFFKKNVWTKRRFRNRNTIICNLVFFKNFHTTRFNPFIVDSMMSHLKPINQTAVRLFKKVLFREIFRAHYYLFLEKRYVFNTYIKRYTNLLSPDLKFFFSSYPTFYVKKRFIARRRRKIWRQVYFLRKHRKYDNNLLFTTFYFNKIQKVFLPSLLKKKKKIFLYSKLVLGDYLKTYSKKLALKKFRDKNFIYKFYARWNFFRRIKNLIYFLKWKPKTIFFPVINIFKRDKKFKKLLFTLLWFSLNLKKFFWRKKKNYKLFFLFFLNKFLFNKTFLIFNSFCKTNFFFTLKKRRKRLFFRLRRRKMTYYNKRRRRRRIKIRIKRKFLRFFLLMLIIKFMKKHKNPKNFFLLRNSFFMQNFKRIHLRFLYSILYNNDSFYFKNNIYFLKSIPFDFLNNKDLRIISLLRKK